MYTMERALSTLKQDHNLVIGYDLDIASDFKARLHYSTVIIVTDTNLAQVYLDNLKADFITHVSPSSRVLSFVIPPGEASKSRATKASIEDFLLEHQCDRESCLVAFGGGVIGDLVGFVASTYLRGISLVHIPTTLLAMVDSSIGGKNGIDTQHGKNLIGTFWNPSCNYINLSFLKSLPEREFYNGMAEIIKMAAISDRGEFERLEQSELLEPGQIQSDNLLYVITTAIQYKTNVVSQDGNDAGLRQLLNFGHTIGHGIEALLSPALLHGECVSIGMVLETKIAIALGQCGSDTLERLLSVLLKYELPVSLTGILDDHKENITVEQIMRIIGIDKKNSGGAIRIVLLAEIGNTVEPRATAVPNAEIKKVLMDEFNAITLQNLRKSFESAKPPLNLDRIPSPCTTTSTFFLCLTLQDLCPVANDLPRLTMGVHAVELRVDLLKCPEDFEFISSNALHEFLLHVANQITILRRHVPGIPIIYTPRTIAEGGKIPDNIPAHLMVAIYLLGFHLGCEIIDIQMNLAPLVLNSLLEIRKENSFTSKIIASFHALKEAIDWNGPEIQKLVEKGQSFGDIVKLASIATSDSDNSALENFTAKYWANNEVSTRFPLIAINIGAVGELSRVRNRYLTPVTHVDLLVAAPGQLTVEQILQRRNVV